MSILHEKKKREKILERGERPSVHWFPEDWNSIWSSPMRCQGFKHCLLPMVGIGGGWTL